MQEMTTEAMRAFITARILSRIAGAGARRDEALRAVLGVAAPGVDENTMAELVARTPELPAALYEKWVGMFADRLVTTIPPEQLQDLCLNTPESNASLQLVYAMFMESERMEREVAADLALYLSSDAAASPDAVGPAPKGKSNGKRSGA